MPRDGARVPKTSFQENVLVNDAVPASTKYKNKWAVSIFADWQRLTEVKVPVLDCGGLFKEYDLHKVTPLSGDMAEMDALSLNYWSSKFVMEVAKKSGGRIISCHIVVVSKDLSCKYTVFSLRLIKFQVL